MHSRSAGVNRCSAGHEVAVVEDVAVGERGALREPGGARRVLDVDRVVGAQRRPPRRQRRRRWRRPLPATISSQSSSQKNTDRSSVGIVGLDLVDHLHVVRRLERRRGEQHPAARLVEHVRQLVRAVRRVDVDEDHADVGRGVLQQRPLGVVRAPQPDPVAGLQPEPHQPGAEPLDPLRRTRRTSTAGPGAGRRAPRWRRGRRSCGAGCRRWSRRAGRRRSDRPPIAGACVSVIAARLRQPAPHRGHGVARGRVDGERLPRLHRRTTGR